MKQIVHKSSQKIGQNGLKYHGNENFPHFSMLSRYVSEVYAVENSDIAHTVIEKYTVQSGNLRPFLHDTGSPTYRIPIPFLIGRAFFCMNPIGSAPTIRYNAAPHQQVVQKWIRYNPYRFVSSVNVVIRYETLPNLTLIIGWLQCK